MNGPVLVVGASGPLGRAVVAELQAHSHEVVGVSRSGRRQLDFTDPESARALLEVVQPRSVIHLARPDGDRADDEALAEFASLCSELGVDRFVFASSAAVYGTHSAVPRREDDELDSRAAYARVKRRSERALARVSLATGLPAISLRIFNIYGPGFEDSLVNRLVRGDHPAVYDTKLFVRDYVHSTDVARAFRLAIEVEHFGYIVLNVGTGTGVSNHDLLTLFPRAPYEPLPGEAVRSLSVADPSRIEALWHFAPSVAVTDLVLYPELVR